MYPYGARYSASHSSSLRKVEAPPARLGMLAGLAKCTFAASLLTAVCMGALAGGRRGDGYALFDVMAKQLGGPFDPQYRGVDADVVGGGGSPCAVGVEVVVSGSFPVRFPHHLQRLFGTLGAVATHDPCNAVVVRSVDEGADADRFVAQDVVCTTAHNDA